MDGENNGKPIKMDDLRVPLFLETPIQSQKASFLEGSQLADSFSVPVSKIQAIVFVDARMT